MKLTTLIPLALKISIILIVFDLGLSASPRDAMYLFRKPGLLGRSLLSMNVIMPIFAASLAGAFDLRPAVKIALIALGVAPVPPILPKKQFKAGGQAPYVYGLLVTAALFATVFIPLAMKLIGMLFSIPLHESSAAIGKVVFLSVLAPLSAGILTRHYAPALAKRLEKPSSFVGSLLLVVSVLPVLFTQWPVIRSLIGNGTLFATAAFIVAGLAVGHLLGGPYPENRTMLALSTSSRHPGIALAIATANFPEQKQVPAAVILYLLVNATISIPYLRWRRHTEVDAKVKV